MKSIYTLCFAFLCSFVFAIPLFADSPVTGWFWSDNIGWTQVTSASLEDQTSGDTTRGITGWAWSDNIGWLKFNAGIPSFAGTVDAVPSSIVGSQLVGWARYCAGTVNGDCNSATRTDGWDGWVKFTNANYQKTKGFITGWAWGSDVVGWTEVMLETDEDGDGCPGDCTGDPPGAPEIRCELTPVALTVADKQWNAACYNSQGNRESCGGMTFVWNPIPGHPDQNNPINNETYVAHFSSAGSGRPVIASATRGSNTYTKLGVCTEATYAPVAYDVNLQMAPEIGTNQFGTLNPTSITVKKGKRAIADYAITGSGIDGGTCRLLKNGQLVAGYEVGNPNQIVNDVANWEIGIHNARVECDREELAGVVQSNIVEVKVINNPVYTEF